MESVVVGYFGFVFLLAIGFWVYAKTIEPPYEYYEEELKEMGVYDEIAPDEDD